MGNLNLSNPSGPVETSAALVMAVRGDEAILAELQNAILSAVPANQVIAGPQSGAAALPAARELVPADLPFVPEIVAALSAADGTVTSNASATLLFTSTKAGVYRVMAGATNVVTGTGTLSVGVLTSINGNPSSRSGSGVVMSIPGSVTSAFSLLVYLPVGSTISWDTTGTWTGTAVVSMTVEFMND